MSFRYRLALFLVAILVGVQAVTAVFAYLYLRQSLVERAKRELSAEMRVFVRQLDFLSQRVTEGVRVLSLDYALRAAIAQHDHNTELSALRNHGQRIGATRMMLIDLDGVVGADTSVPAKKTTTFPFPSLLQAAAIRDRGTALVALDGQIYWMVVEPVRAPVPIAFIAACIPVDGAFLEDLRHLSAEPPVIVLALRGRDGRWRVGTQSLEHLKRPVLPRATDPPLNASGERSDDGHDYLTITRRLETAAESVPVVAILSYPLDQALAAYRAIVFPLLIVLGLALLAALAGAMIIVRGVSRPLEQLAGAARRIAAGDYTAMPRIRQRDEIGHLSGALANMTHSIAERENALKSAIESAEVARNEAVRANDAKSQFLGNMSHELRTPLNAIVGFSEMIGQQVLGPIGQARYLDYANDIRASGAHLLRLVERMLDLAEADARQLTIANQPLKPGQLLHETVEAVEFFAEKSGVAVGLDADMGEWPEIYGDAVKLKQAFVNLVDNAVKFTPAGGEVRITGYIREGRLAIRIADSGIGMEPEVLANVVRPFHRLRSALDGQHQGAGLGLPFAKVVIELHGGTLFLASSIGAGTTVTIELPVRAGALTVAA